MPGIPINYILEALLQFASSGCKKHVPEGCKKVLQRNFVVFVENQCIKYKNKNTRYSIVFFLFLREKEAFGYIACIILRPVNVKLLSKSTTSQTIFKPNLDLSLLSAINCCNTKQDSNQQYPPIFQLQIIKKKMPLVAIFI